MKNRKASAQNQKMIIAVVAVIIVAAAAYFLFFQPKPSPSPVPNKAPIVVTASSKTFATVGDTITFSADGSRDADGSIEIYSWNLGDGTTDEGEEVDHVYNASLLHSW